MPPLPHPQSCNTVLGLEPGHRGATIDRVHILMDLEEYQEAVNKAREAAQSHQGDHEFMQVGRGRRWVGGSRARSGVEEQPGAAGWCLITVGKPLCGQVLAAPRGLASAPAAPRLSPRVAP